MAAAETAGEAIERYYANELYHLERCVACAQAYSQLMALTAAVMQDMSETAAALSPAEAFAAILFEDVQKQAGPLPGLQEAVYWVVAGLPAMFTSLPTSAGDIRTPEIEALVKTAPQAAQMPSLVPTLAGSLRAHVAALRDFLERTADQVWGRVVQNVSGSEYGWRFLRLTLAPEAAIATLAAHQTGADWHLADLYTDDPVPVRVSVLAERVDPLKCRITLFVDRPGLRVREGRPARLDFAGQTLEGRIDSTGAVRFEPIPVGAIPGLEIRF
jgi:hypothetical protein